MSTLHICDVGYKLAPDICDFLKVHGFDVVPLGYVPVQSGDIIFGRWGLAKANDMSDEELDGVMLACPMTNIRHLNPRNAEGASITKLNPLDTAVRDIRSSGEYTFTLCVMALKALLDVSLEGAERKLADRQKNWAYMSSQMLEFSEVRVGFVGMGRNGNMVAEMLEAIGCSCSYYDPHVDLDLPHRPSVKTLSELFSVSHCVVLTVTLDDESRYMLDLDELCPHASNLSIINTSRPDLIVEATLCSALREGRLARYLADFPLLDGKLLEELHSDPETSNKFFWSNHIGGASGRSATIADRIVIEQALLSYGR